MARASLLQEQVRWPHDRAVAAERRELRWMKPAGPNRDGIRCAIKWTDPCASRLEPLPQYASTDGLRSFAAGRSCRQPQRRSLRQVKNRAGRQAERMVQRDEGESGCKSRGKSGRLRFGERATSFELRSSTRSTHCGCRAKSGASSCTPVSFHWRQQPNGVLSR